MIWVCITFVISATSYSISYDRRECLRRGQRELCFRPGDHHVETEGERSNEPDGHWSVADWV